MFLWNDEILLKLFVRWAKLLDFFCEFFDKFVRTATYVCSGTFWSFLARKVVIWAFSVSERKYPAFGKKFIEGCQKCILRDLSKTSEKRIELIYTIIISSRTLSEFFSDFDRKSHQVCRNRNLSVQRENFNKKTPEQFGFRHFWTSSREDWSLR